MLTVTDEKTTISEMNKKPWNAGVNNANLKNRINEEAIGIALTSVFKYERLLKMINTLTTNMVKVKYSSLMLLEGETLRIKYSNHLPEKIENECKVKLGDGISGWVASTGLSVLVKDIESDTRFAKKNNMRYSSKSCMSVPLITSKKIIGVLNVNDKINGELFNESDLNILKIISRYSAIAIRNVALFVKSKKLSLVRQLDNDYYDKSNKYLPVTLKSLKIGPFNKSELYLKNDVNGVHNYVLYWKGGDRLFINEKREEFIRKNIKKLYVPKNGRKQYLRFIETNLERIVEDENTSLKEKFSVAQDVAVNIYSDLSAIPHEVCNIERAKQWINTITDLIRGSGKSYIDLSNVNGNGVYLHGHSISVTMISLFFAHHMGLNIEEIGKLGLGLFLQDIGMSNVDPLIVNKPAKLNSQEYTLIKKHSEIGFQVLQETGQVPPESCMLALLHHENFNGTGYPYGLKADDIHFYGRISRIVDAYSAITSDRSYAKAKPSDVACMIMKEKMNELFDSEILCDFVDFITSCRQVIKHAG